MQQNKGGEVELFKLFGLFSIIFVPFLVAGTFEHFERFHQSAFVKYSDAEDIAFKKYLDAEYKEFLLQVPLKRYSEKKPSRLSVTQSIQTPNVGPRVDMQIPSYKEPTIPPKQSLKNKDIVFDFFGVEVGFNFDKKIQDAKFYPRNQVGISKFFEQLASSEYTYLVADIKLFIKQYHFNDWGLNLLVQKITQKIFKQKDEADIFRWFLLTKLGYDVHLSLVKKHIVLFFLTKQKVYDQYSILFQKKRYYSLDKESFSKEIGSVYSYTHNYKNGLRKFDFALQTLPLLSQNIKRKELYFREYATKYTISFQYNQNIIDFLATYPQLEEEVYFDAIIDPLTHRTLFLSLQKYVDAKRASGAIEFLLHFTQGAFEYKVDKKQFGYEKMMFAQETLVYDASDCEDRAVLFSFLIQKILHLSVVALVYKNHFSTALYIPLNGDKIDVQGRDFIISDPSYLNANIGQSLTQYRNKKPKKIIFVKK